MFRIENNVPEVYINDSRDFQLLSRIYDTVFAGVKYNTDSLRHTANTGEINTQLLPLLGYKLGFFTHLNIDADQLRHILQIFPSIIHKKGTLAAVKETLNLWFRINNLPARAIKVMRNAQKHCITVDLGSDSFDTTLLDEVLKFILVAGYYVEYNFVTYASISDSDFISTDDITVNELKTAENSKLPTDSTTARVGFTRTYDKENIGNGE